MHRVRASKTRRASVAAREPYLREEKNMQVKSINSQHPEKNIQGPKIIKLKSDKFAEAPLTRKLKDALLRKTQEKYPAIRDFLTCAASHRAPEQSTLDDLSAIRDEVVSYIESMVEHRRSMSQSSKTQFLVRLWI